MFKRPWIVFEGGEGSGKSTQATLLAQALAAAEVPYFHTREPGGCENSEKIRHLLVESQGDAWDRVSELLLHLAARREHVMKAILPALEGGEWVICDRFNPSTVAYQAFGHGLPPQLVFQLIHASIGVIQPPLVIWFDVDVEQGLARAHSRNDTNQYEALGVKFHERVKAGYEYYAKLYPQQVSVCKVGKKTVESIHKEVITTVNNRFGSLLKPVE